MQIVSPQLLEKHASYVWTFTTCITIIDHIGKSQSLNVLKHFLDLQEYQINYKQLGCSSIFQHHLIWWVSRQSPIIR